MGLSKWPGAAPASGSITEADLADGSVTRDKLGSNAVGSGNLGNNSVITARVADGAITAAKLAPGARSVSLHFARRSTAAQTMSGTAEQTLTYETNDVNESGGMDAVTGIFTAPSAGIAEFIAAPAFKSSSALDTVNLRAFVNLEIVHVTQSQLPSGRDRVDPCIGMAVMAPGDELQVKVFGIDGGNDVTHRYSSFIVRFYTTA